MKPKDAQRAHELDLALENYSRERRPLPGIQDPAMRATLIEQLVDSLHRVRFAAALRTLKLSEKRAQPSSEIFDELKAAVIHQKRGDIDEAFWLVFLFVHFGRYRGRYIREVYGKLGSQPHWTWTEVSASPKDFRKWLSLHRAHLERPGIGRGFGNHRKYETLDPYSDRGTGEVVETYVKWVGPAKSHEEKFGAALKLSGDPRGAFDFLYRSMSAVKKFGRLARFDYLTMVAKLGLTNIQPGSAFLVNATGPAEGARLLLGGNSDSAYARRQLDQYLVELDEHLSVGMQVIEDALCNWAKSPRRFIHFRG